MNTPPTTSPATNAIQIASDIEVIRSAVSAHRLRYVDERGLQDAVARALANAGVEARAEVVIAPGARIDFLVGRVGIEIKVDGAPAAVERQLRRYLRSDALDALVLITNRVRHARIASPASAKPISVLVTLDGAFG
jgi:hypothetical protein